jgi:hypothetical protein
MFCDAPGNDIPLDLGGGQIAQRCYIIARKAGVSILSNVNKCVRRTSTE